MLATEDVVIAGIINLNGEVTGGTAGVRSRPGPGGYAGGLLAAAGQAGGHGLGPGGGAADTSTPFDGTRGDQGNSGSHATAGSVGTDNEFPAAPTYGDHRLLLLTGGSGGGGGGTIFGGTSRSGGAGGGAILIASSGSITVTGTVTANGGAGSGPLDGSDGSGGGAGGAVRLIANAITGTGSLRAQGEGGVGGVGYIRLDATSITGTINSIPSATAGSNTILELDAMIRPVITITSIGGQAVPPDPSGNIGSADVVIPNTVSNPVTIAIDTERVPQNSIIHVRIPTEDGDLVTVDSTPVAANGTASATATLPFGAGVVYATVDFP
jgi:hypothetical protein